MLRLCLDAVYVCNAKCRIMIVSSDTRLELAIVPRLLFGETRVGTVVIS